MIILEGPDGSGKSTLLGVLAARYPDAVTRHSGGPIKSEDDYLQRTAQFLTAPNNTIWDRCMFISEDAYAKPFGRKLPPSYRFMQRAAFAARTPLVVWCVPPAGYQLGEQDNPVFDTPEYVAKLKSTRDEVLRRYADISTYWNCCDNTTYRWQLTDSFLALCDRYVR